MMNTTEIKAKYLAQHDTLGSRKDAVDKALFDQQHAPIWADCDAELRERKAYLEAQASLTADETKELAELERMFPTPAPTLASHHSFELSLQPPDLPGIAQRVDYIETFLKALYP